MSSDLHLLQRYHGEADAAAFRELVTRHAGMVFATARRVTRDPALADDVVQETFLELARRAPTITESVGAWLHRVATRRACNVVRNLATRRRNEEAAAMPALGRAEATWEELEPVIDEALDELPASLREPVVEHFLGGRTQQEVAARLGVNQSTVSRLLERGLGELRAALRRRDVVVGAALALHLSSAQTNVAPPTSLIDVFARLASGSDGSRAATQWATPGFRSWKPVAIAAAVALAASMIFIGAGGFSTRSTSSFESVATTPPSNESGSAPAPSTDTALAMAMGQAWPSPLPSGAVLQLFGTLAEINETGESRTHAVPTFNVTVGGSANAVAGALRFTVVASARADGAVRLQIRLFEEAASAEAAPLAEFDVATAPETSAEAREGAYTLAIAVTRRRELEPPVIAPPPAASAGWDS